jgi:hypothetical protein
MKKKLAIAFCLLLLITPSGSVAETSNVVINGCVNKKTFTVRLVDKCTKDERRVQWNSRGVDGVDGKDGLNGKDGVDGVDGKDGLNGRDGINGKDGVNGRDGVPGIAGPKGEKGDAGKDGSQNTIYWGYIKTKDILASSSRTVVVVDSKNLNLPIPAAGQQFRLAAKVAIESTERPQARVGCYWTNKVTLDEGKGSGWGAFDFQYTSNYRAVLNPTAIMLISKPTDSVLLVCSVSESAKIIEGFVSAEAVLGSYQGSVGD